MLWYRLKSLLWPVIWVNIIFVNLAYTQNLTLGLGFVAPINKSFGVTSHLGQELVSAYKLAIAAVNTKLLQQGSNFTFSAEYPKLIEDEGRDPEVTCRDLANSFNNNDQIVGIIGAFSSQCSILLNKNLVSQGSTLSQISYGSTSMELSDIAKYPRFFRTCPSDINQAQALADLLKHFRWRTVGLLASQDLNRKGMIQEFIRRANNHGILIAEQGKFTPKDSTEEISEQLQKIKNSGARINVIFAEGDQVMMIFKEAKKKKMTGDGWVWIGSDRVSSVWLTADKDVKQAAQGLVSLSPLMSSGALLLTVVIDWFGHPDYPGIIWKSSEPSVSPYVAEVYDAVYAYYYAMQGLIKSKQISTNTSIKIIRNLLFEKLKTFKDEQSGFEGLSGHPVYFDVDANTHDPPGRYNILNYKDDVYRQVGNWSETSKGINLPGDAIIWPSGTKIVPTDKGSPGKPMFKIGFLSPLDARLGQLSKLGRELLSAFKVAIDIVNTGKNYHIELDAKTYDAGFDGKKSCEKVAQRLINDRVIAVIGALRSQCSMEISKVLGTETYQVPIISYGSASAILSNKTEHKFFFRLVPTAIHQAKALTRLIEKYSFKQVGAIFTNNKGPQEIANNFIKDMHNRSIQVSIQEQIAPNADVFSTRQAIKKVKDFGSHVNIISALPHDAETIYQQFKELSMTGKGWVYISTDTATATDFNGNAELAKALHGLVGITPKSGEGHLYLTFLSTWLGKDPLSYPGIVHSLPSPKSMPFTTQVFDAVNGVALSLSDLIIKKEIGYNTNIRTVRNKLYQRLKKYSDLASGYPSASGLGSIYFDKNQDGPPIYDIINLVDSNWKTIGSYSAQLDRLTLNQDPIFPGGLAIPVVGAGKVMYKIAGIFPKHHTLGSLAELGNYWEKAFKVATAWVNRNQSLQIGFKYITYDGGPNERSCATVARNIPDDVQLVIGEARSACTQSAYQVLELRGIPMITYASTASALTDKLAYPNLFRICASDENQALAFHQLIEKCHWDKIGIIAADNSYGRGMSTYLDGILQANSVRIVQVQKFSLGKRMSSPVKLSPLKNAGAGVNIVISPASDVEKVFQEAFEEGMTGKGWTWLGSDGATSATFSKSHHLRIAMQGMVGFGPRRGEGIVFDNILIDWDADMSTKKRQIPYIAQVFDAVLASAHTLHRLHVKKLIQETTTPKELRNLIRQELRKMTSPRTGFDSATGGRMFFDRNQDGLPAYDLLNLNGESWVKVGSYDVNGLEITDNVIWSGGTVKTPPSDPPSMGKPDNDSSKSGAPSTGLVVLSVIFSIFGLLVIAFMVYIIRRVRYRHLYMQSDVASGGLFSVLYGHRQNHSFRRAQSRVAYHTNADTLKSVELADSPEYSVARHA